MPQSSASVMPGLIFSRIALNPSSETFADLRRHSSSSGLFFHEHRTQNRIRIDDIRHTAESVRDIHHDRIREHVPASNAQLFTLNSPRIVFQSGCLEPG
ncbi:MAG: hypothetical protein V8T87_04770 [Victivallales bacterium]